MSTATPNAAPARDFSDWFSPMLVKELRQGLRGRVFVITFLALQGFLIFTMLAEMTAQNDLSVFWALVGLVLMVVMPLRGLGTVGLEIRAQTMELVQLTRLSAARIVFGKWSALYAQSLLFVIAVLPYMLLRYYVAGVEVVGQLTTLLELLAVSAILTAATVGISAHLGTTLRLIGATIVALVALLIGGVVVPQVIMQYAAVTGTASPMAGTGSLILLLWLVVFAALFVALMVAAGAAALAPPSENHPARIRLLGLAILLIAPGAGLLTDDWPVIAMATVVALLFVCIHAMVEEPAYLPSLAAPFVRRGMAGRLLGRFLYPGWPSGLLYVTATLALATMVTAILSVTFETDSTEEAVAGSLIVGLTLLGSLTMPTALTKLVAPHSTNTFMNFIWIQLFFGLLTPLVLLMDKVMESTPLPTEFAPLLSVFPPCTVWLIAMDQVEPESFPFYLTTTSMATTLILLALLWRALPHYRRARAMEQAARAQTQPATPAEAATAS